ncbi:MAG: S41 family peptidase [Planctomycetota bacterium]
MNERTLAALRAGLLVSIGVLLAMVASQLRERWFRGDLERVQDAIDRVAEFVDDEYAYPLEPEEIAENAIAGMLDNLDQHSRFFPERETEEVENQTSGTYHGIGAVFAPWADEEQFLFALPGSPAERAGMQPGDRLVRIDGTPVEETDTAFRHDLMSNDRGRPVQLDLVGRDGSERTIEVVPEQVGNPSVRHVQVLDEEHGIGYFAVTSFSKRTPGEFDAAVAALRAVGADRLLVDLRRNPGGVLRSAIELANRFVGDGALVISQSRTERREWRAEPGDDWYAGTALVLLVDGESASASEVLAGALQDHRAAVLVGTQTFGKGCVQTLRRLDSLGIGGMVKLTTSVYRTPAGRLIDRRYQEQGAGLAPDLVVTIDDAAHRELAAFLRAYSPNFEQRAPLVAWQRESPELPILPDLPRDAQVEAGLALLRGDHPGPYAHQP